MLSPPCHSKSETKRSFSPTARGQTICVISIMDLSLSYLTRRSVLRSGIACTSRHGTVSLYSGATSAMSSTAATETGRVHWPDHAPASLGIFGLSHEDLLQSEWVQNDTLTVKFELEVRPYEYASSRPFSLAAEVPAPTMSEDTHALLEEGNCSDVQFMVQDEVIHAHSQVLCARSEVFSKQLTAGMQESVSKVIVIEDCEAATFKAFLQFLYTDQLPDSRELLPKGASSDETDSGSPLSRLQALLAVSHKYQVKRLQIWCEARLSEEIVKSQVCGILCQAHLLQAKQLEMACLTFIKHHMSQVLMMPSYAELIRKWPQVALKVSLFSAGVSKTEALAAIDAFEKPQELQWEEPTDSREFLYQ